MTPLRIGSFTAIAAYLAFSAPARAGELTVQVSPFRVTEGESVQLRIQLEVPLSTAVFDPQFEAPDFTRLGASAQGMNVMYTSDTSQATKSVYYTYVLSPNKTGVLTIKNIHVRTNQGEFTGPNQRITVEADHGQGRARQAQRPQPKRPQLDPNDPFAQFRNLPGFPPGFPFGDEDDPFAGEDQNPAAPPGAGNPAAPPPPPAPGLPAPAPPGAGKLGALDPRDRPERLNSDFTVHATLSKKKAYVGEPIVVEYSLYDFGGLTAVEVNKWPVFTGFWKEDLEIATRFEFNEVYLGNQIARRAFLGRYAIYGIKPGKFNLDKMTIQGRYSERSVGFFRGPERIGTHSSPDITLEILPLPEAGRPPKFTGVVGKFALKLNADKATVAQNTPITLSLTVTGAGNFQSIESIKVPLPPDFEIYDSSTGSRGVVPLGVHRELENSKTFTYTAIPRKAGKFKIDPVEWTYFDPETAQYVTARTEPLELSVEASAAGAAQGNNSYLAPAAPGPGGAAAGSEIAPLRELTGNETARSGSLVLRLLVAAAALLNIYLLYRFLELKAGRYLGRYLEDPFEEAKNELRDAKDVRDDSWLGHLESALLSGMEVLLGANPRGLPRAELHDQWQEKALPEPMFARIGGLLDRMDQQRFSSGKGAGKARAEMQADTGKLIEEMGKLRKRG